MSDDTGDTGAVAAIEKAHASDPWSREFAPIVWRPHRIVEHAEGTYIDVEPPDVILERPFRTCSYCGSITPEHFLDVLEKPGTHYSGSDWKYGWPHKFYVEIPSEAPFRTTLIARTSWNDKSERVREIVHGERRMDHCKFYSTHLADASSAVMARWQKVASPLLGVHFLKDDTGRLLWFAPQGFQTWGVVGEGTDPMAPQVPDDFLEALGTRITARTWK